MIVELKNPDEKRRVVRAILEALPDWFGIAESREQYIAESAGQPCFAAMEAGEPVGFLCLKPTGDATLELAVMGVLKEHHRHGVGRALFAVARNWARDAGYAFMQVKTVKMGVYEDYDRTNLFYRSLGFREFEVFPLLWDEANPCQIYVMALGEYRKRQRHGLPLGNPCLIICAYRKRRKKSHSSSLHSAAASSRMLQWNTWPRCTSLPP